MAVGVDFLDIGTDFATHRRADCEEWIVGGCGAVRVEPQDDAREMGVVRLRSPERVVDDRWRQERPVRQVLQPPSAALVAHEDIELAVRPEPHHAAVVVAVLVRVVRAWMAGNRNVVGLAGAQQDEILRQRQRRAIPDEAIDAVAEQRHVGHPRAIRARAALRPTNEHVRSRREVRMQYQAQQASLRVRVHRQVENRYRLNDAVDDPLHLTRCLFQHEGVVRPDEDDADWLIQPADEGGDLEVGVEDRERRRVRAHGCRGDQPHDQGNEPDQQLGHALLRSFATEPRATPVPQGERYLFWKLLHARDLYRRNCKIPRRS